MHTDSGTGGLQTTVFLSPPVQRGEQEKQQLQQQLTQQGAAYRQLRQTHQEELQAANQRTQQQVQQLQEQVSQILNTCKDLLF